MILIQEITRKFADRVLLNAITYHFPKKARIALVGDNGAGKTTLLNILCGIDEPDSGHMVKPKDCVLGYLPQEPNPTPHKALLGECLAGAGELYAMHQELEALLQKMGEDYSEALYETYEKLEIQFRHQGGYELEANAKGILVGLGFKTHQLSQDPLTLSGGWRMRLEIAKLLVKAPDFLVLDEPTNHLDLPSLVWLEDYLLQFTGTLVFVSHDADLLNRLATHTLHLRKGQLTPYVGNFEAFLVQYEQTTQQQIQTAKNLQRQSEHVQSFVTRFGAKASKATQARSRLKMLTRIKTLLEAVNCDRENPEIKLNLQVKQKSGQQALVLKDAQIGYNTALIKNFNLTLQRGQKLAIVGANGIGKSTLLKSIVGLIPLLNGQATWGHNVQWAYYAQDQLDQLDPQRTVLENVLNANPQGTEQQARRLLGGFLIQGQDVFKPLKVLSGGEKSRVGLSCLLAREANFLLLDEPTNHLDLSSTAILSEALASYTGCILFVSHNRSFIQTVATHVLKVWETGKWQIDPIDSEWSDL